MRATSTIESTKKHILTNTEQRDVNLNTTTSTKKRRTPAKQSHPHHVLHITSEIKRLIANKKDRHELLDSVCNYLTQKRGYYDAWIAVLDETQEIVTTAETNRPDSPPVSEYRFRSALAACLEYGGRSFGLISASIPSDPAIVEKEQALFKEFAYEVAHALHDIDLEEKSRLADEEIQAAQSQLVQTQKLATIGKLAASVAHEVNNNLTAILMASSFLLSKIEGANPNRPEIETIKGEALRTRSVVKNLLDFSRQSNGNASVLDINEVIKNSVTVLKHPIILKGVKLNEQYREDELKVAVNKNQIMQVFCNLINNALDAMSKGDSLSIRTGIDDKHAFIQIADTGAGISPRHLETIFEPFFTTKPDAKGTGLGLSISNNIVKRFGGKIEVESKLGHGTTFTVLLPVSDGNMPQQ